MFLEAVEAIYRDLEQEWAEVIGAEATWNGVPARPATSLVSPLPGLCSRRCWVRDEVAAYPMTIMESAAGGRRARVRGREHQDSHGDRRQRAGRRQSRAAKTMAGLVDLGRRPRVADGFTVPSRRTAAGIGGLRRRRRGLFWAADYLHPPASREKFSALTPHPAEPPVPDPITRLNAALRGRYLIERELGEGGMATVYLAEDLKHERKVALKVLKPELAAVVGAERFLAEIKTTANLQPPAHPPAVRLGRGGLVPLLCHAVRSGRDAQGALDREKQLPIDEAIGIATAVAAALEHAHDRGVIHRDIKPANILLQDGQPVVADFGIALAVGAAGGSRLTETGLSVGTPYYMSPEQATGDQQVGPASDTYSLAALLYEMLTGDPPYIGGTAQAVLGKIIQGLRSPTAVRRSSSTQRGRGHPQRRWRSSRQTDSPVHRPSPRRSRMRSIPLWRRVRSCGRPAGREPRHLHRGRCSGRVRRAGRVGADPALPGGAQGPALLAGGISRPVPQRVDEPVG